MRRTSRSKAEDGKRSLAVRGVNSNLPLKIDEATGAVPGERIVGILKRGQGITIYPIFSEALQKFDDEPDLWVDLAWAEDVEGDLYPARLHVVLHNEVGALGQLTQCIADGGANIENLQMTTRARDFYNIDVTVEVEDIRHLNRIIKRYDLNMIYVSGPGHGGPAVVGNTYLEGTYSEVYPKITQDSKSGKSMKLSVMVTH